MAKKQKTFFEKLTEKNYDHDNNKKSSSAKKRNKKAYIVLGLLAATVIGAIAIPLGISANKVNYIDADPGDSTAFYSISKDGSKSTVSIDDFSNYLKDSSINQEKIDALEKEAIFYLYDQEYQASKLFQRVWNASRLDGEKERTDLALKSLDERRNQIKNKLLDLKSNLKKNYGYQNWEKEYLKILQSESYGSSSNEEDAIEYVLLNDIKSVALSRYTLESSSNSLFSSEKIINREINSDVYELDSNGNVVIDSSTGQQKILYSKGDKPFAKYFTKGVNYFTNENSSSIYVFKTQSFDPKYWSNAVSFVDSYLAKNNLYVLNTLTLTGKKPSVPTGNWTVDKDKFINMALYWINTNQVVRSTSLLNQFKTLSEYVLSPDSTEKYEMIANYKNYLQFLSVDSDSLKLKFGSTGVTSALDLFTNQSPSMLFTTVANIFENGENKLPEVDLLELFKINFNAETQTKIDEILAQIEAEKAKENSDSDIISDLTEELNKLISNYIKSLSDEDFQKLVNSIYSSAFVLEKDDEKFFSVAYNIKGMENARLILTDSGLSVVKFNEITSKDQFMKLLENDLSNYARNQASYFNTLSLVNKENSNMNFILEDLLNNDSFVSYLKEQKHPYSSESSDVVVTYHDEDIQELKNINKSIYTGNHQKSIVSAFTKVNTWVKELINSQTSWNLSLEDSEYFIDYNKKADNQLSEKDIENTAFEYLQNQLSKGDK